MKKIKCPRAVMAILVLLFTVSLSNCSITTGTSKSTYKAKKLPPGQAKKIYGGKSAKKYAPGQNK
ncbi:hypothetical protein [Flavobacterium degerlachei]|jgi:hypothetical protein|uniref:Quinol oxidase subunit 4 n=1 Tax=Flavobacterium degerlachei TaxID=229203 RepID=A0A1H2RHA0_9FLAO|nr:hypothetical protein [Flavobacterium degerlachei]SDW18608.1 hypothetical protein SAMN05444338_101428 [Flavobacterium degerlachei]